MQPPSLATYESAAQSIYEPQKQAEQTQITATNAATKTALEAEKGQVATDYQSAVDKLTQSVQDQTQSLNQLYSERLGGNFSGLQGNDLGKLYARTNEAQSIIEQTRANKLSQITAGETQADIKMNADLASLAPKYQSLETQYAQSAYGSAVKDYQSQLYKQAQLQLSQERLGLDYQKAANDAASKSQSQYKVTGKGGQDVYDQYGNLIKSGKGFQNGYSFTGANGKPINMAEYISGAGMGTQDVVDLLQNGSSYDRWVLGNAVNSLGGSKKFQAASDSTIMNAIKKADKGGYYGF